MTKKRKAAVSTVETKSKRVRNNSDLKRYHLQLFEIRDPEFTNVVDKTFLTDDALVVMQSNRLVCYCVRDRTLLRIIPVPVNTSALSDGILVGNDTLVVVSRDFDVFVIDLTSGEIIYSFKETKSTEGTIINTSYRDSKLIMCTMQEIVVIELDMDVIKSEENDKKKISHKTLCHFEVEEEIESCALWTKGIITGGKDGYLRFYEIGKEQPFKRIQAGVAQPHQSQASIYNIHVMNMDPSIAITHSYDGQLKKWDLETDLMLQSIQTEKKNGGHALCIHEESNLVITGQHWDPTVRFWTLDTLELLFPFRIKAESDNNEKLQHVNKITTSPDATCIALGTNINVAFLFRNLRKRPL
jgi:WD40 repeat protein